LEKAQLCQKAEHDFAGVPCGIMDQAASVFGEADHLLLMDCRNNVVNPVPFRDPALGVLIVNTNVSHSLDDGAYALRRQQCEAAAEAMGVDSFRDARLNLLDSIGDPVARNRARHVIGEIDRTQAAAAALEVADWAAFGKMMAASHRSLRDDYEVSCPELDTVVDLHDEIGPAGGVIGARMTGGGFGGCTVSLVELAKAEAIAEHVASGYTAATGITPTIFLSRPAQGAQVLQRE
jgi:galactokinase